MTEQRVRSDRGQATTLEPDESLPLREAFDDLIAESDESGPEPAAGPSQASEPEPSDSEADPSEPAPESEPSDSEAEPADADAEVPEPEPADPESEASEAELLEPVPTEPVPADAVQEADPVDDDSAPAEPEVAAEPAASDARTRDALLWPGERSHRRANVMVGVGLVLVIGVVVAAVTGVLLLQRVHRIRAQAAVLQAQLRAAESVVNGGSGGVAALSTRTSRDVAGLQASALSLRHSTEGALWSVTDWIPGLSGSMHATRTLALITGELADNVLPTYISASHVLAGQNIETGLRLAPLVAQQPGLDAALPAINELQVEANDLHHTGIASLDAAISQVRVELNRLDGYAQTLAVAAHVAPAMLGADGDRSTLVVLQTPAESRGTGGLVGGFVELRAHAGRLTVTQEGTNHYLHTSPTPVPEADPEFQALYGSRAATTNWTDSNLSPDFPQVANVWAGLYKYDSGHAVDGVVGLTPELLGRVLTVTGPIVLPGGETIDGANAAELLEKGLYARYPAFAQEPQRTAYQLQILNGVVTALLHYHGDPIALLKALGTGAGAGELRLYSTDSALQAQIATMPIAGQLSRASGPFFGVATINADGTKLDAYLSRTTSYRRQAIPGDPLHQRVTATVTLTNHAPHSGLPAYVTYRADLSDSQRAAATPGDHRVYVDAYLSTDAVFVQATVDGVAATPGIVGREGGHLFVEVVPPVIAPGASVTVTVVGKEIVSTQQPGTFVQPTVLGDPS